MTPIGPRCNRATRTPSVTWPSSTPSDSPLVSVILLWPATDSPAWRTTLDSVLAEPSAGLVLLPDTEAGRALLSTAELGEVRRARCLAKAQPFACAITEATGTCPPGDLVIIAAPSRLPSGWLGRVALAATSDDTVAGASPLVRGSGGEMFAGFAGVEERPGATQPATYAAPAIHPRVTGLSPYCAYLRRPTLELLDGPDNALSSPRGVLDDLAERALARGLSWALADDVYVVPAAPADAAASPHGLDGSETGPLRQALLSARVRLVGLSVTIDARGLGPSFGGTQTYTAALVRALARSGQVRVRAVVGEATTAQRLGAACGEDEVGVEVVTYDQVLAGVPRSDVVHRPQQVFSPHDLALLRLLGERLVITHLDLIAYQSPGYHASQQQWRAYRRSTRLALGMADRVVFLSEHGRREAIAEELITAPRSAVAGIGVTPSDDPPSRPADVPDGVPLLVMIGADYQHKNRPFALRLLGQLRRRGWPGTLVLAGAHVPHGSSAAQEARELRADPALAAHVVDLGPIAEAEKHWLLSTADALLCPSTYEGYGLTPLEAVAAGLPCVYANLTSLGELLGAPAATIVPWDAAASAERVLPLLSPGPQRERHLALLAATLASCRWELIVQRLIALYTAAVDSPYRAATQWGWEELEREHALRDLRSRVAYGLRLVDRDGLLTRPQQRGLMRVAVRPWLRAPLLGPLGLLGRQRADDPD